MSTYIELDFDGEYQELLKFMEEKGWEFSAKRKDKTVAYFKIPKDLKEEIEFFKGFDLESTNTRIESICDITGDEFENCEEYSEQKPFKPTFVPPQEDDEILASEREAFKNKEEENTAFNFWGSGETTNEEIKLDTTEITAKLPQKAGVKQNDPMCYLTSAPFVNKFLLISSVVLFIMSLIH